MGASQSIICCGLLWKRSRALYRRFGGEWSGLYDRQRRPRPPLNPRLGLQGLEAARLLLVEVALVVAALLLLLLLLLLLFQGVAEPEG